MTSVMSSVEPVDGGAMCENDGFLDKVWEYFLRDYENVEEDVEDDIFSEESEEEILSQALSEAGFESFHNDELDVRTNDESRYTEPEDHTSYSEHEDESASEDFLSGDMTREKRNKAIELAASLQRTAALLQYARQLEAAKKKAAKDKSKSKTSRRGTERSRKRIDQIPEDREYNFEDNTDDNSRRVGPPQTIYVQNDVYEIEDGDRVTPREMRNMPTNSPTEVEVRRDQNPRTYEEKGAKAQSPMTSRVSSSIEEMQAKRKEIHRRIALLRIRAAKARMAAEENSIYGPPSSQYK